MRQFLLLILVFISQALFGQASGNTSNAESNQFDKILNYRIVASIGNETLEYIDNPTKAIPFVVFLKQRTNKRFRELFTT